MKINNGEVIFQDLGYGRQDVIKTIGGAIITITYNQNTGIETVWVSIDNTNFTSDKKIR